MELITLVDKNDLIIGYDEKLKVHKFGKLHRAFSLFVFDKFKQTMLIQKRAMNKYHSGGLWTNACCSHPGKDEELWRAVCRRTKDELGVAIPESDYQLGYMWESGKFLYQKNFGDYTEYEIDHVFIWSVDNSLLNFTPNRHEIDKLLWIKISDLINQMEGKPEEFTAWFFPAFEIFINDILCSSTTMCTPIPTSLNKVIKIKNSEVQASFKTNE